MVRGHGPARGLVMLATLAAMTAAMTAARAAEPPLAAVTLVGAPETVFSAKRDACDGDDVADISARAFRDAGGEIVIFALHTLNRALRGPDFDHLKIDCRPALRSAGNTDPARYDDASWIAATWTDDGQSVEALVHHEYQANTHPGRCTAGSYLACWYNTVTALASSDGGRTFRPRTPPAVVAAAPFRQEVGQGRHRGFFNPSNIFAEGRFRYFLASTTGWSGQAGSTGQDSGPCLFRSATPHDPTSWTAYDGRGFGARFPDPYRGTPKPATCRPLEPFPAPVGGVVRHRGTGAWIAVFQASANGGRFPQPGFYTTSSRDLIRWDEPRLLLAGVTLYDDPCKAQGRLIAYPSLIDRDAQGRNFDDVGDTADLYYASLRTEGCAVTSERDLVRRRVTIRILP